MDTSVFWARVFGIMLVVFAAAIFPQQKQFTKMMKAAAGSPMTIYLLGFFALFTGIVVMVTHQIWTYDWRLVITLLGWGMFFKGLTRLMFPDKASSWMLATTKNPALLNGGLLFGMGLGLVLLYFGFILY